MCPTFEDARDRMKSRAAALGEGELATWRDQVAAAPDLRLAKVMRVRRAIVANQYDEEAMLDRSLGQIHAEIGMLCRTEYADD
jgi:hypothetical protein